MFGTSLIPLPLKTNQPTNQQANKQTTPPHPPPPQKKSNSTPWYVLIFRRHSRRGPAQIACEIKSREVVLGWRVGLLLLQLFPNGGATDIVFVTVLNNSWDSNCRNILLFWRRSTAALVFRVGACFEVSLFCPPFPHSSPSLSLLRGR